MLILPFPSVSASPADSASERERGGVGGGRRRRRGRGGEEGGESLERTHVKEKKKAMRDQGERIAYTALGEKREEERIEREEEGRAARFPFPPPLLLSVSWRSTEGEEGKVRERESGCKKEKQGRVRERRRRKRTDGRTNRRMFAATEQEEKEHKQAGGG